MRILIARFARIMGKPPSYIAKRVLSEVRHQLDRFVVPRRVRAFNEVRLLRATGDASIVLLWERLAVQPWAFDTTRRDPVRFDVAFPGMRAEIVDRAARATRLDVDILGSGRMTLCRDIPWHVDFKTGDSWPSGWFRDIPIVDVTRPSDVKVPWELSRKQWLLPLGQAFLLDGDERHAEAARDILIDWIAANPVAGTVNWAIAMEPALRAFTWCWLFRVFAGTAAWSVLAFRSAFLQSLYQHGVFVHRYIERADVNGNHYAADLAALVLLGAFFGRGDCPQRWFDEGWRELEREMPLQVLPDGVDFEASTAYHRLVGELFLLAAMIASTAGRVPSATYRDRLRRMAGFSAAYMRPDGTCPLWGDADDARVLPMGVAPVTDHWHFVASVAAYLEDHELAGVAERGRDEVYWLLGETAADELPVWTRDLGSCAFPDGGVYILRAPGAHVFIDCGPVGLAGRGGHGHNDILAFDAVLGGVAVVTDSGSYVYTASVEQRNRFRATAAHNTPQIDSQEVNRFVSASDLWSLHDDAQATHVQFEAACGGFFRGSHTGYGRLTQHVRPMRHVELSADGGILRVTDSFEGSGHHAVRIPLLLAPGCIVEGGCNGRILVAQRERRFSIDWAGDGHWSVHAETAQVAPSYGVLVEATRLVWAAEGAIAALNLGLVITVL